MADHDHTYKVLFSHAEMVADLIRGFVHEEWVEELDFSSLEGAGAAFLAEEPGSNLETMLFQLDKGLGVATANKVLMSLLVSLMVPEPGLPRQAFATWLAAVLNNRRQEERQEALERLRGVLLREMEERFGVIPESVRGKVAALDSCEEIVRLIARTATASSLAEMDF